MINSKKKQVISAVVIIFLIFLPVTAYSIDLRTAAQDSSPKYYLSESGEMTGLCVDIIHEVEKVSPEINIYGYQNYVPFKRLQYQLEENQINVFFGFKKTEKRKKKYIFIDIPLYPLNYVLAIRADDNIIIQDFDDIRLLKKKGIILTVFGSATNRFLHKQGGLRINGLAKSPSILIKMLKNKRGRFAFYHDLGLRHIIRNEGYIDDIIILPVSFSHYTHYAAFSRNVSLETINKVESAIQKIKNNGTLEKIFNNYSY